MKEIIINELMHLIGVAVAVVLGFAIGFERKLRYKEAGIRTHAIVCVGAALIMVVSKYAFAGMDADASRVAAQIVSGVGFLGAGTIMREGPSVKGLTTAAGLWASACMGLAIGAGFYECMFLDFALILLCICLLPHIDAIIVSRAHNMNSYVEFTSLDDVGAIIGRIKEQGARIYEVDIIQDRKESALYPCAVFSIRLSQPRTHGRMIMAIYELDRVIAIDEV